MGITCGLADLTADAGVGKGGFFAREVRRCGIEGISGFISSSGLKIHGNRMRLIEKMALLKPFTTGKDCVQFSKKISFVPFKLRVSTEPKKY